MRTSVSTRCTSTVVPYQGCPDNVFHLTVSTMYFLLQSKQNITNQTGNRDFPSGFVWKHTLFRSGYSVGLLVFSIFLIIDLIVTVHLTGSQSFGSRWSKEVKHRSFVLHLSAQNSSRSRTRKLTPRLHRYLVGRQFLDVLTVYAVNMSGAPLDSYLFRVYQNGSSISFWVAAVWQWLSLQSCVDSIKHCCSRNIFEGGNFHNMLD